MKQYKDRLGSITSLQSRETNKDNNKKMQTESYVNHQIKSI